MRAARRAEALSEGATDWALDLIHMSWQDRPASETAAALNKRLAEYSFPEQSQTRLRYPESAVSFDLLTEGAEIGLRPGERVPSNLLCWISPERSARLTELLDARGFTAVLIDPRNELEPCAVALTEAIEGAGVRCDVLRLTGAGPAGEADAGSIPAPPETLEALASGPRLLIVRPDGYVGCRAPAADAPASVERFFAGLEAPSSA